MMIYKLKELLLNSIYLWKTRKKNKNNATDEKAQKSERKRSLLIYRTARIGDFVLFLPAVSELLASYGDWNKILICHPCCKELAGAVGLWNEIICFDYVKYKSSVGYQRQMEQIMSSISVDKLFNMEYSRTTYTEIMIRLIYAKEKYSFDGPCFTTKYIHEKSNGQYKELLPLDVGMMELEKNTKYAAWITKRKINPRIGYISTMTDFSLNEQYYYIIAPGASYQEKTWPEVRFAQLIDRLWERYHMPCYLSGSQNEMQLAENILQSVKKGIVINYIGKTSLMENFDFIRGAQFLIGNDSASVHIAAAVRTISFSITGGWDAERFLPYTVEKDQIYAPTPIRVKMQCYGCAVNGGINKKRFCNVIPNGKYRDDKRHLCIEAVTVQLVEKVVTERYDGIYDSQKNTGCRGYND